MASRLWTNPPLKTDGTLDYAQLTLAEICEDITESLSDLVFNAGAENLVPFLDALPETSSFSKDAIPPTSLVQLMERLLILENDDPCFRESESRTVIADVVREFEKLDDSIAQ